MAKKISSKDIFAQEDIFKGIRDSAKLTIKQMKLLKKEVEGTASQLKKSMGEKPKMESQQAIQKVVKTQQEANKLKKDAIQIEKLHSQALQQERRAIQELEKIQQQKIKTEQQASRLAVQQRKEKERLEKFARKQVKTIADESNASKKLVIETRIAKNESKRLGAEMLILERAGKRNTKEYRSLAQSYRTMGKAARQGDKDLKKLDATVGDNFRNVGNYKGAISGLVGTLGTLGAGIGIGQIFRNVTGIMIDFDQSQADLAAISGKTKQELAGLTAQAKELGRTTQFSATEISNMQIELAKLGFTTNQIEKSTDDVANFAAATGSDLASAAQVAGSAMRMFGMEAYEMSRVVSTLGVATTKSALSFGDFETALSTIGPVAQVFGFSIEDTTALLAQLKNAGFDASSAATATRKILLNLADANGELAQEIGRPVKSLDQMADAFKEIQEKGIDLAKALELTDVKSVSAFATFLQGSDTLVEMRDSITGVDAELENMADKRLDSVAGQMKLVSSAWEGFILGVDDSTGASKKMKDMLGFLAENLAEIMNAVIELTRIFLIYQAVTKGQILINKLMASSFMQSTKNMKGLSGMAAKVGGAFRSMGNAIKRNLGGIALVLVADLVMKMKSLNDVVNTTARNMDELAEAQGVVTANTEAEIVEIDALFDALRKANHTSVERKNLIDEINSRYGTTLSYLDDEETAILAVEQAYQDLMKTMRAKSELEGARVGFEVTQRQKVEMKTELEKMMQVLGPKYFVSKSGDKFMKARAKVKGGTGLSNFLGSAFRSVFGMTDYQSIAKEYNALVDQYDMTLKRAEDYKKDYVDKLAKFSSMTTTTTTTTPPPPPKPLGTPTKKEYDTSIKDIKEYNSQYFKLQQDRRKNDEKLRQEDVNDVLRGEVMNAVKRAKELGEAEVEIQEKMFAEETQLRKDFLREEAILELQNAKETILQRQQLERDALQKEYDDKLKKIPKYERTKRKELTANAKIVMADLKAQQELELEDLKLSMKLKAETLKTTFKDLDKNLVAQTQSFNDAINEALEEFAEGTNEASQEASENAIATAKATADAIKENWKTLSEFIKLGADYFIEQSNRKIAQIDKEIAKAEESYNHFKTLAQNGNIDAKESLAEQQRIIDEKNRERLKQEKIQQRIRLTETVLTTYASKQEANAQNPLAETIRDTTLLMQFINSLPAFEKGTEDTGKNGQGVDGRGGFHAVLHPNERVVPKSLNDKIGNLTNEELTRIAVEYQNGKTLEGNNSSRSSLDFAILVNGINELKDVVKNKPETNIELGEITTSVMEVVKSTKQGNATTYNRFKIRK